MLVRLAMIFFSVGLSQHLLNIGPDKILADGGEGKRYIVLLWDLWHPMVTFLGGLVFGWKAPITALAQIRS